MEKFLAKKMSPSDYEKFLAAPREKKQRTPSKERKRQPDLLQKLMQSSKNTKIIDGENSTANSTINYTHNATNTTVASTSTSKGSLPTISRPEWELDDKDLETVKRLGEGASGTVWKEIHNGKDKTRTVAIKILKSNNDEKELAEFITEFSIMITIKSPYIVEFYGATLKNRHCMVMEYCEIGSLYGLLQSDTVDFSWERMFQMIEEIVKGIQCLHNRNPPIMHRDLKTLNVLVTKDFHCRLADFGLSRFDTSSNMPTLEKVRGTFAYIAPESMDGKFKYTVKADIYSIAIIIWEFAQRCVTGVYKRPYYDVPNVVNEFVYLYKAAKANKRPIIPDKCPPSLIKLITGAWEKDPNARPDANLLLEQVEKVHNEYKENKVTWDAIPPPKVEKSGENTKEETSEDDEDLDDD